MLHAKAIVISVTTTRTTEGSKTTTVVRILDGQEEGSTWNLVGNAEVDDIINVKFHPDDQFCYLDAQTVRARLEVLGFKHTMTGGSCTAFIRDLPEGHEVWVTLADEDDDPVPDVPLKFTDRIWVGTYADSEAEKPIDLWIGTVEDYIKKLEG